MCALNGMLVWYLEVAVDRTLPALNRGLISVCPAKLGGIDKPQGNDKRQPMPCLEAVPCIRDSEPAGDVNNICC